MFHIFNYSFWSNNRLPKSTVVVILLEILTFFCKISICFVQKLDICFLMDLHHLECLKTRFDYLYRKSSTMSELKIHKLIILWNIIIWNRNILIARLWILASINFTLFQPIYRSTDTGILLLCSAKIYWYYSVWHLNIFKLNSNILKKNLH